MCRVLLPVIAYHSHSGWKCQSQWNQWIYPLIINWIRRTRSKRESARSTKWQLIWCASTVAMGVQALINAIALPIQDKNICLYLSLSLSRSSLCLPWIIWFHRNLPRKRPVGGCSTSLESGKCLRCKLEMVREDIQKGGEDQWHKWKQENDNCIKNVAQIMWFKKFRSHALSLLHLSFSRIRCPFGF